MDHCEQLTRRDFIGDALRLGAAGAVVPYANALGQAVDSRSSPWQIGCYTRPWDQYEYRVALDAIAEAGFKYVGLMTTKSQTRLVISVSTTIEEAAKVGEEVKNRGLKVSSVYGGDIPVGKSLKAGIEGLRRLIDNCAACGAVNLLMGGVGDEKLYEPYYRAIAECCDYAAEKRVGISVKPHGGLNATGPQCRKAVEFVGHKNFRIWYDPGNILYYSDGKLDPVDDAAAVDGLVVGMCIKDYVHPKNVTVTPGTGQVNFGAVLARLKQGGFAGGPLIIECLAPGDLEQTLAEAKKARLFVEQVGARVAAEPARRRISKAGELQAGVAVADITPPIGYRMCGYFYERQSTGILNPLRAKALVLHQGNERAAMVFCDIIGVSPEVSSRARSKAESETGIPAANILIAATHAHTGPHYYDVLRNHFHEAAVAKHGNDPCEQVDYSSELVAKIVGAIKGADAAVRPAHIRAGVAQQEGLSFNRRFHMKDGTVRFNPGILNPDIVKPAGPIDPDVGIVLISDAATDSPFAGIVTFALHLDTVGGTQFAADYPYFLEQSLREAYGKEFVLLFGVGTCGDINHIDVTKKDRLKTEYIGQTLAKTVIDKVAALGAVGEPRLGVRRNMIEVPLQKYTREQLAKARQDMKKVGMREMEFLKEVEACKIMKLAAYAGDTVRLEVQVFRLGRDVAVVGLPGEVFVDLGLAIKRASPFATTLVIELCQTSASSVEPQAPGYIPTKKAFVEGSYETVNSVIEPGGGEAMADAAISLLKSSVF